MAFGPPSARAHAGEGPLPRSPNPIGLAPSPRTGHPSSAVPPDPDPSISPGPASPPPRRYPQPDAPREYRDLGDSRSRSALSNEMKSEGIAAQPSPARGQREGGGRRWRRHSSPRPRAPNRGRRGEGGCRCLLLQGSDSHQAKTKAAGWRGNSTGTESWRARRGVQGGERGVKSQRVCLELLRREN